MIKLENISIYLGYSVSAVTLIFGIILLSGVASQYFPTTHLRVMFGIVLTLWGIYRFIVTRTRSRQKREDE